MKLSKVKSSTHALEAGFCCLFRRPNETDQDQKQQARLKKQGFAASAEAPMKLSKVKSSNLVLRSRILLPLSKTE